VNLFFKSSSSPANKLESNLLRLAAVFLFIMSAELTLAQAVRLRSWDVTYRWQHWLGWLVWYVAMLAFYIILNQRIPDHDPYILPMCGG
jgi:hypothetical protein